MKPTGAGTAAHAGTPAESITMQLDQSSLAHLMSVLTDLYSDPVSAVLREYSTNALDSHKEAGQTKPVEVGLPAYGSPSPELVIRDYGVGLSVEELRTVYSMYGKSTKRDSDAVAGMLGLGCKSGLTYATSFTVRAVQDGRLAVAVVSRDEAGIGSIRVIDEQDADEHDGVEVRVPVRRGDEHLFRAAASMYTYWPEGSVLVDGQPPEPLPPTTLWVDQDVALLPYQGDTNLVVMGGVAYPFEARDDGFNHGVVAWIPMGSVDFTPSREALHMTRRTKGTLKTVEDYARTYLGPALIREVEKLPTPYERAVLLDGWKGRKQFPRAARIRLEELAGKMDTSVPSGKTAFRFTGEKAVRLQGQVPWKSLGDPGIAVVTDFPNTTVAAAHRQRIVSVSGLSQWLTLPPGTDTRSLEGHPAVFTWQEVLEKAPKPAKREPGERRQRRKPEPRRGVKAGKAVEVADGAGPILHCKPQWTGHYSVKFPEAQVVGVTAGQLRKLLREHPSAEDVNSYASRRAQELRAQLTERDKLVAHVPAMAARLKDRAADLLDPMLLECIGAIGEKQSPAALACTTAGVGIPEPKANYAAKLEKRYPLLAAAWAQYYYGQKVPLDDAVEYANMKYAKVAKDEKRKTEDAA